MSEQAKILLIEDDVSLNEQLHEILISNQFHVEQCFDGEAGLEKALSNQFDLILMDINMPVKNGITATNEIRAFNTTIPILALTAVEIEEMRFSIFESGMNDIIVKPYDVTKFVQTISKNIVSPKFPSSGNIQLKAI